jgi:quinol monooxygenase YgiN
MVSKGLLIEAQAAPGKDAEVEEFLRSGLTLVQQETFTTAWFALRLGRAGYAVFNVFPDEVGRDAHLAGPTAKGLMEGVDALFSEPPRVRKLDVLANKLPVAAIDGPDTKALLLTFKAKAGNEPEVEQFLRDARVLVYDEPDTTAWFAFRRDDSEYGIFDVFPDHVGRFKHLTGHVARELVKHGLSLLGSLPDPELLDVVSEKLAV